MSHAKKKRHFHCFFEVMIVGVATLGRKKKSLGGGKKKGCMENPGIDPGTSRMLSERSTI